MVGGGRRGHVAAARKTGATESWRATAEEAERGGALAGGRYTARRGCVCVCARCVCAVEHWHLVLVPARVNLLGAFRRLPLAQELGLHTQSQAQARSPPMRRNSGCTVLWPRAWRVLCRLRPQVSNRRLRQHAPSTLSSASTPEPTPSRPSAAHARMSCRLCVANSTNADGARQRPK
jgi:hypothetical protein